MQDTREGGTKRVILQSRLRRWGVPLGRSGGGTVDGVLHDGRRRRPLGMRELADAFAIRSRQEARVHDTTKERSSRAPDGAGWCKEALAGRRRGAMCAQSS